MQMKMKRISTAALLLASTLLASGSVGCGNKSSPTQRQKAEAQWNGTRAKVLQSLAQDQYETGNFDQARKTINEAVKLDPKSAGARILSAKLAIEQGQLELAERELTAAREADEKNAEADYLTGVIYQRWQKFDEAHWFYASAVEKQPTELAYVLAQMEMLVAMSRNREAIALLQEKSANFEHSAVLREAQGELLLQEHRYVEAADLLRQASVLATDDQDIRENLAIALFYAGKYEESATVLNRLLKNDPYSKRAELWITLGECNVHLSRPRDARSAFETATQLSAGSAEAWLGLAKSSLAMNDLQRADLSLRKAMSIHAASSEAHLLLGYVRVKQNRLNDALSAFKKASALDPQDTVSVCMIGYVLEKSGKSEEAMRYYGKALKIKPDDELATKLMAGVEP